MRTWPISAVINVDGFGVKFGSFLVPILYFRPEDAALYPLLDTVFTKEAPTYVRKLLPSHVTTIFFQEDKLTCDPLIDPAGAYVPPTKF
jgi:hypothetical protein